MCAHELDARLVRARWGGVEDRGAGVAGVEHVARLEPEDVHLDVAATMESTANKQRTVDISCGIPVTTGRRSQSQAVAAMNLNPTLERQIVGIQHTHEQRGPSRSVS